MRSVLLFLLLLVIIFPILTCDNQPEDQLRGAWIMVTGKYKGPDLNVECDMDTRICYKILSDRHFAVVEMYKENPDSNFFAAVGKYRYHGDVYEETLEASSNTNMVGQTNVFQSELEDDRWKIQRQNQDFEMQETWKKVR